MRPITLAAHEREITCVRINADGDLLFTAAADKRMMCWYLENGERIGTYDGHNGAVYDCDVDLKSKYLISAAADASAKLWDVASGKCLATYKYENDYAPRRRVHWGYDQKTFLYTTARYKDEHCRIVIQKIGDDPTDPPEPTTTITCTKYLITDCKWGPLNKTVIAVSEDGYLRQYDAKTGQILNEIEHSSGEQKEITCIEYSHDKTRFLVCGRDKAIKLYDSRTFEVLETYMATKPLNAVALHPRLPIIMACGGEKAINVALTGADKGRFEVHFYHLIYKELIGEVKTGHYSPLTKCALYPDGEGFVTGSHEGNAKLFRLDANFEAKFKAIFGEMNIDALPESAKHGQA